MPREPQDWTAEFVWAVGSTASVSTIRFEATGSEEKVKARAASLIRQKYGNCFTIHSVRLTGK